jgi:putative chromate ion transporter
MVFLNHRFPGLGRWTGSWSGLWGKSATSSGNSVGTSAKLQVMAGAVAGASDSQQPKTGRIRRLWNSKSRQAAATVGTEYISACSQMPLPLHWRKVTILVAWLSLFLAVDLFLIRLRPELLQMGTRFLRIGALVFGSGYAMLPFIQDTVVNQFNWLTNQQFAVALALSLITPGPVTIIGTFIGYKVAGVVGALVGMVNMYFPAWAMTTIVAAPYAKAGQAGHVKQVIGGIVAAFIGTLVVVLINLARSTLVDIPAISMAAAAFGIQRFTKIDTIWIVLSGALVSLVVFR